MRAARVAFNADLGDGSPGFRRLAMTTIARAAGRHLEWLIAACEQARDAACERLAEPLRYAMLDLTEQVDRLGRAASPATVAFLRDEVGMVLDRLEAQPREADLRPHERALAPRHRARSGAALIRAVGQRRPRRARPTHRH